MRAPRATCANNAGSRCAGARYRSECFTFCAPRRCWPSVYFRPERSNQDKIAPNPTTVVAAETPIAAGPSQSRCNDPHLSVSTLERGRHERGEDRDRRANFLTRALSVEHPAVLPTAHSFSHEPTCSSFHTLACCTYGARRMQRFSPGCRRPWRHERGRGSRLTGQLSYTRALGRASCCAAYSSGAAVCRGASLSVHPAAELLVVQVEAEAARSEAEWRRRQTEWEELAQLG